MMKIFTLLAPAALVIGCSSPASPHVVTGSVEQRSFNVPVDQVAVVQAGTLIAKALVGSHGEFSLTIPPGNTYRLEFTAPTDRNGLVSPRPTGVVRSTFAVRGGGVPFDVGVVRAIGTAANVTFIYGPTPGECQDGKDANGAVCVDDQQAESCDQVDSTDGEGDNADGSDSTGNGGGPDTSAVADHNIPSSIGCGDGGDSGGDHQNTGEEQGDH